MRNLLFAIAMLLLAPTLVNAADAFFGAELVGVNAVDFDVGPAPNVDVAVAAEASTSYLVKYCSVNFDNELTGPVLYLHKDDLRSVSASASTDRLNYIAVAAGHYQNPGGAFT